ncbi:hypothetical protein LSH36_519g04111 [Paralvinella palmiformis]|uniref:Uncharacterized protein n=1 Tax=Paralvinella palmiformis TaxID=53620 RepID=A0AAD9J7T3_9ANNE|nr:hypothetical protein LSH36_519g04111 [Paralvinella palmiformis]
MRLVFLLLAVVCCAVGDAEQVIRSSDSCQSKLAGTAAPEIESSLKVWEGILLVLGFGAFALLFSLIHWLVRTYVYFDAHRFDTFFDAGGDVTTAMVMCSVVTKWAWTASYTWSVYDMVKYGVVGQFWFCAGLIIQPLLFAIVACEIRIKAPGAKTFLQVIYARYGVPAHVVFMLFALFVNIYVASMVMYDGSNLLHILLKDIRKEILTVVLAGAVLLFTVFGGVGGSLYTAYVSLVLVMAFVVCFVVEVYYDPWNRQAAPLGSWKAIYKAVSCYRVSDNAENDANSALTFLSKGGLIEGVLMIMSGLSTMFVNQGFWQTSVTAKPTQAVWGYILGAFVWFAIPLGLTFSLGSAYQVWTVDNGAALLSENQAVGGLLPIYITSRLLPKFGDYLTLCLTAVIVVTTAASQVLSVSSIIIYDIYQTYISPFRRSVTGPSTNTDLETLPVRSNLAEHNDEFEHYDRRCMMLKHVVVTAMSLLLIPLTLVLFVMEVDTLYLFKVLGVISGCCVLPICFSVTWYRVTGLGVSLGAFAGLISGLLGWLVYAATMPGGLVRFRANTGQWQPLLVGTAFSFVVGGLVTVITSLCCGGCDSDMLEEDQWEKTRAIDSPILPWAVKYAPEFKSMKLKGIPHFFAVRRTFKFAEISAYIVGVLISVLVILIWPACMLLTGDWTESVYGGWVLMVVIWVGVATVVAVLFPLVAEIVVVCRQSYYVKKWSRSSPNDTKPLEEDIVSQPEHSIAPDANSVKTVESDYMSTIDSGLDNTFKNERWKTLIHLQ